MSKSAFTRAIIGRTSKANDGVLGPTQSLLITTVILILLTLSTACQTTAPQATVQPPEATAQPPEQLPAPELLLREGDILRISFPGSPNLNTIQQVRLDGKINLPMIGEFKAVGMTPAALEKELLKLYEPQIVSKEVSVTIEGSSFPVFVTGAVLRPGKINSNHPLTVLEAIMEAGGFDYSKANRKGVIIIRQEANEVKNYRINLKSVMSGTKTAPFYLKPSDMVYVPEKFTIF